jgi:hypothetical protein
MTVALRIYEYLFHCEKLTFFRCNREIWHRYISLDSPLQPYCHVEPMPFSKSSCCADQLCLSVIFGQLFNVLPCRNTLASKDLTGHQIVRLLKQQWGRASRRGVVMSVSNGFTYTWDAAAPPGAARGQRRPVQPGSLALQGAPVLADKHHREVTNSLPAEGGDDFTVFSKEKAGKRAMSPLPWSSSIYA